jgi:hypothetical protein
VRFGGTPSALNDVRARQCASMAAALRTLRAHFGRERFDRRLYETVSPGFGISMGRDEEEAALRIAERCQ